MQFIHALSLAPDVNHWLANSQHPGILHIFDHACNLINERREVLSIVTSQMGDGPFSLVVEDQFSFLDYLALGSRVSISPTQLTLGNLIIHTAKAKRWNPRPDWEMLHITRDDILNQIISLHKQRLSQPTLLAMTSAQFSNSLASELSSAVVNADISSAQKLASQLAGLGIGLTPSGDDFMMGAIYAAWILHPSEVASVLSQEIASTAAPLTTSLSAAWLRSAAKGESGILWHELFDVLVSRDHMHMEEAIENILAVGETSGADALAGFTSVFVFWSEKAGSQHE